MAEYRPRSEKQPQSLPDDQLKNPRRQADAEKIARNKAKDQTLSKRTVQHVYVTLNSMLSKAVQWDILKTNPLNKVDRPKAAKRRVKALTEERAIELLRCLNKEENMGYRAAVMLGLLCGLRLGEVGALKLSDVDFKEGTIDISRALNYTPRTGNYEDDPKTEAGKRPIDLPPGMMTLLESVRDYQEEMKQRVGDVWVGKGWIVHAWNGARLHHDTPSKWFRKFADRNGFEDITFHQLRHTHATILFANNLDAVAIATRMGHEDPAITLRVYAHALRRRDREAAATMQTILDHATQSPDNRKENNHDATQNDTARKN